MLAVEAARLVPGESAERALRRSLLDSRVRAVADVGEALLAARSQGKQLVAVTEGGELVRANPSNGRGGEPLRDRSRGGRRVLRGRRDCSHHRAATVGCGSSCPTARFRVCPRRATRAARRSRRTGRVRLSSPARACVSSTSRSAPSAARLSTSRRRERRRSRATTAASSREAPTGVCSCGQDRAGGASIRCESNSGIRRTSPSAPMARSLRARARTAPGASGERPTGAFRPFSRGV